MSLTSKYLIIFLSLIHHLISADSNCLRRRSFHCPNLGLLQFPISNPNQTTCRGPLTIDCAGPSIQLENGGPWYDVVRRISESSFRIRDPLLQTRLNTSSCSSFVRGLSLPTSSPSISLRVSSRVTTVFRCNDPPLNQDPTLINQYFFAQNYTRFAGCPGFVVFYRSPGNWSEGGEVAVPEACQAVVLPLGGSRNVLGVLGLSGEFDVEWNVSAVCLDCYQRGGVCGSTNGNEFSCTSQGGNRKTVKVALLTESDRNFFPREGILIKTFHIKYLGSIEKIIQNKH
ncbi:2-oxoglutarate (2OG) and Fe(II)-dependent oxygenase superfamily protein [Striga asiatica]|uniref:2-oxoglutarate (2OG) and Fe(II)-dependent oxygenase superfamily protein n=1 Tax=Striga asiatica TaxID=4170 RepID=A0A5A7QFP9_STRAF|nr:2-oxoglutarate (2OG) and Fe(II)-dependent oxygenase superfamily protein [Striga asiatica]